MLRYPRVRFWLTMSILMLAAEAVPAVAATTFIFYVDPDARGQTDGSSWGNAFSDLQTALKVAGTWPKPIEIRVAKGVYKPDRGRGKTPGDRSAYFGLMNRVSLKGGYAGFGEPNPDARDIKLYETILSGDLKGNDIGDIGDPSRGDNSYNVVVAMEIDATAVLDGFTITGGDSTGLPNNSGAGMNCFVANPVVRNCTFRKNRAGGAGGGLHSIHRSPTLTDCAFVDNQAGQWGGGACVATSVTFERCAFTNNIAQRGGAFTNLSCPSVLTDCTLAGNSAAEDGGGIYNQSGSPTLTNCTFTGNSSHGAYGGGLYNFASGNATVTDCAFVENRSAWSGGGVCNYDSSPTFINCTFNRNSAVAGGGMADGGWGGTPANPTLYNCTFIANRAQEIGGGVSNADRAHPTLVGCTFAGNVATFGAKPWRSYCGAALVVNGEDSTATLADCILWGDLPDEVRGGSAVRVVYSDVQGGWPGDGNIDLDPLFVDPRGENLHLAARSPCINAGDPAYIAAAGAKDIDGDPRVVNGRTDMGADEFTSTPAMIRVSGARFVDANGRLVSFIGGPSPEPLVLAVQNIGPGALQWRISEDCPWLEVSPAAGDAAGEIDEVTLRVDTSGMTPGRYSCELTVTAPGAANSPLRVPVDIYFLAADHDEEFVGPFPSWLNVKTDYGAVGDGIADDTAAIQNALDQIRKTDSRKKVVYLPAGAYRITSTLKLERQSHQEAHGVGIIGEDPGATTIVWDGPVGEPMLFYNPWYARMGRLTLDGRGRAGFGIKHGPQFTTSNEFADMVFKDVEVGIEGGIGTANGIAETAVVRCRFSRCRDAGVSLTNWNSLDWWIWYCVFEDCDTGVTNTHGAGDFHVYESFFFNSRCFDVSIGNLGMFSVRDNVSLYSRMFFWWDHWNIGAQLALQGNTIIEPDGDYAITIGTSGPNLLFDNTILARADQKTGPVVYHRGWSKSDVVCVGNTYSVENPVFVDGRLRTLDEKVVPPGSVQWTVPPIPTTPPNRQRQVFEVPAGAGAAAIQSAIDQAARLMGRRPVVHLPAATYRIDRTLMIPANSDLQLVGDGMCEDATNLVWSGSGSGPVLRLMGPSRATLREFLVNPGLSASAIVVENCDQPGARVFMSQSLATSGQAGLLVDGLRHTDVSLCNFGHGTNGVGVKVVGANDAEPNDEGRVVIFSGASADNDTSYDVANGGKLLARDLWYETGTKPGFIRLTDSGQLTLDAMVVGIQTNESMPPVVLDGFSGKATLLNVDLRSLRNEIPAQIVLQGAGQEMNLLALGTTSAVNIPLGTEPPDTFLVNRSPDASYAVLNSNWHTLDTLGSGQQAVRMVTEEGTEDPGFLREMLAQTRKERPRLITAVPDGATDLRLYRVFVTHHGAVPSTGVAIHLKGRVQ